MVRSILFLLGWFAILLLMPQRGVADQPRVGERYPDFTLPNIVDGKPASLSDYRGRKVLLIQFASW